MRIITRRGPQRLAATAALAALGLVGQAMAQYATYAPAQVQYGAAQPPYAAAQSPYAQYGYGIQTQTPPQYAAQGAYQGYLATQQTAFTQTPGYAVPRTAMAYQGGAAATTPAVAAPAAAAPGGDTLPLTPPAESVPAGAMQNGGYAPTQATPGPESYGYAPTPYPANGGYESYPGAGAGCATGNCGTGYGYDGYGAACNTTPYGACDAYSTYGGMGGKLGKHAGCGYWFGGVYGLLMDRDESDKISSSASAAPSAALRSTRATPVAAARACRPGASKARTGPFLRTTPRRFTSIRPRFAPIQ
jgi:hypothetical protein